MNKFRISSKLVILLFFVLSCSKKEVKEGNLVPKQKTVINKIINPNKYTANQKESVLNWIGRKVSSGHNGTIALKDGFLNVSLDGIINGEFNIDMNSISVSDLQGGGKASLERHLKNEDFFSVDDFPLAKIVFKANKKNIVKNQLDLNAQLTIKDITHPLKFTAEIIEVSPKLKIKSDLVFDRSLYDVRYGSGKFFENLGDRLILDEIQIGVDLEFN